MSAEPYYTDESACECGCGGSPSPGRRFITHHNFRTLERTEEHRRRISEACTVAWATKRQRKPLGSRRLDHQGYWLIKVREGGVRWDKEHVLVVEKAIGRRLVTGEQVHHINGVRADNRLENLQLCANTSEHMRIEHTFKKLLASLMESGAVVYDPERKEYRCG